MKGVVLAGGLGTRLYPLTEVINKHLLPVGTKPMIFYPLQLLADAGIDEVLLVVGGKSTAEFLQLLRDGKRFGLKTLYYAYQEGEGGIADALRLAEPFANGESICVVLGDNVILGDSLRPYLEHYEDRGAMVLLKDVPDPQNYGCPIMDPSGTVIKRIVEKPKAQELGLLSKAVIGVYFYDTSVFDRIDLCEKSARGELEITDVNNSYAKIGWLDFADLKGWWGDAGASFEALVRVSEKVKEVEEAERKEEYQST